MNPYALYKTDITDLRIDGIIIPREVLYVMYEFSDYRWQNNTTLRIPEIDDICRSRGFRLVRSERWYYPYSSTIREPLSIWVREDQVWKLQDLCKVLFERDKKRNELKTKIELEEKEDKERKEKITAERLKEFEFKDVYCGK